MTTAGKQLEAPILGSVIIGQRFEKIEGGGTDGDIRGVCEGRAANGDRNISVKTKIVWIICGFADPKEIVGSYGKVFHKFFSEKI
jgi:hypothetical protein